jgi:hypothetical protein
MEIAGLQELDGSWSDAAALGVAKARWPEFTENVFATICALALLRVKENGRHAAWALIEQKALTWLAQQGISNIDGLIARMIAELSA